MILPILIAIFTFVICYIKWIYTYWQRKGFPYVEPKIPFGILDGVFKQKVSFGTAIEQVYRQSRDKVIGVYLATRPALVICDAQLARDIQTKDFDSFHDRGVYVDDENDPQSNGGIFYQQGQNWKNLRSKLTPSFTSGKLKAMFGTMEDVSDRLVNYLNTKIPDEGTKEIEMKELMSIYAIDIIASVILGLEVNSFIEPNNEVLNVSRKVNEPNFGSVVRGTAQFLYPSNFANKDPGFPEGGPGSTYSKISMGIDRASDKDRDENMNVLEGLCIRLGWREEAPNMMREIAKHTIKMREDRNITRKDMLQQLMQLRNPEQVSTDDNDWSAKYTKDSIKQMSIETIGSNLYLFYVAGFETISSAIAFTAFELAQYPEALKKVQKDVRETLARHDNKFTYEAVQDMKYLDHCIMETTRKYPSLPILNRECTRDYPIPDSSLVIKKGTPVIMSLLGMHRDPKYFPDPMIWDPERFESKNYDPTAFMPFGEGPRHCIAQRMGKVNAKVALGKVLLNFNIELNPVRTEIEFASHGIPIIAKGGLNVRLSKRKPTE